MAASLKGLIPQKGRCDECCSSHKNVVEYQCIDYYDGGRTYTARYCLDCKKESDFYYCRSCKKFVMGDSEWDFRLHRSVRKKVTKCEFCTGEIPLADAVDMFWEKELIFHTPYGNFKKGDAAIAKEIFFGVEFEVEFNYQNRGSQKFQLKDFRKAFKDRADVTEDGSLDNGIEIRTNPMTFEELYRSKVWDKFFTEAKKTKAFEHRATTTGMHVHVSENALARADIDRIVDFFIKYNAFVCAVAERGSSEYVEYKKSSMNSHYGAVNHARDTKTYEFRIFQTVVDKTHFYKNLEFVKALIDYCNSNKGEITNNKFFSFINRRYTQYPNLKKFMYEMGFRVKLRRNRKTKVERKVAIGRREMAKV